MTVLVFAELDSTAGELIAKAQEIAKGLGTDVTALAGPTNSGEKLAKLGADKIVNLQTAATFAITESYADAISEACSELKPQVVLIGSTRWGKEVAARAAGKLGWGCAVDCSSVSLDASKALVVERLVLGGNAVAMEQFTSLPAIVAIPPKTIPCNAEDPTRKPQVGDKTFSLPEPKLKLSKTSKREVAGVKLDAAQVVVSCGRGLKNKDDVKLVLELAKTLSGELGCSRPIAADLKWLPKEHWVGLSGIKVKPRLYVAVGISGQIQHLAGMRDSSIIVAINKDKDAPIFKAADYGIIGDLYKVLPELMAQLKSCSK